MKPRLFLDTNIMLDLLGERVPYYNAAAGVATLADKGQLTIVVSALSYATVNYILNKYEEAKAVREKLRKFKVISEMHWLDEVIIEKGLNSKFRDFEDALQYHSALSSNCTILITRNGKDFKEAAIPVMTADEYLAGIK